MTYATDEASAYASAPVELFEFTSSEGGAWYYTSEREAYTYLGHTYSPLPVARAEVDQAPQGASGGGNAQEMLVTITRTAEVITANGYGVPPESLTCRIHRIQRVSGAGIVLWDGEVTDILTKGEEAEVRVNCVLDDALATSLPGAYTQASCNHALYSTECGVSQAAHSAATTITAISGRDVTVASVGGHPDDFYRGGRLTLASGYARRLIVAHVGNVLTLSAPLRTAAVGASVALAEGCDRSVRTCRDKFANAIRHGGHPYIAVRDPFNADLSEAF